MVKPQNGNDRDDTMMERYLELQQSQTREFLMCFSIKHTPGLRWWWWKVQNTLSARTGQYLVGASFNVRHFKRRTWPEDQALGHERVSRETLFNDRVRPPTLSTQTDDSSGLEIAEHYSVSGYG